MIKIRYTNYIIKKLTLLLSSDYTKSIDSALKVYYTMLNNKAIKKHSHACKSELGGLFARQLFSDLPDPAIFCLDADPAGS